MTWSGTPAGIINGLCANGVEVVPINLDSRPALRRKASLAVMSLRYLRSGWDLPDVIASAAQAASMSPDIGHIYTRSAAKAIHQAGRLDGIIQIGCDYQLATQAPVVTFEFEDMTVRQLETHPYPGYDLLTKSDINRRVAVQRNVYLKAYACCSTTPWAAASVIDHYGIAPQKVHAVGVGANFGTAGAIERDWTNPRFLFVGVGWKRKNGDAVLRAFASLIHEFPAAQLDIVGHHPGLNIPGVTSHGVLRRDVPSDRFRLETLFTTATCFVMPSLVEASAIAYVDAAAAGLPSIGSSKGGSDFLIGEGGIVIDPTDDTSLLAAMRQMSQPREAAKLGELAKRRSGLFTWPKVAARLLRAGPWLDRDLVVPSARPTHADPASPGRSVRVLIHT